MLKLIDLRLGQDAGADAFAREDALDVSLPIQHDDFSPPVLDPQRDDAPVIERCCKAEASAARHPLPGAVRAGPIQIVEVVVVVADLRLRDHDLVAPRQRKPRVALDLPDLFRLPVPRLPHQAWPRIAV